MTDFNSATSLLHKNKHYPRLIAIIFFIFIFSFPVNAQDALSVAPQAYKLVMENDWVRVVGVHYAAYEKLSSHDHPKRPTIFVYLNNSGHVQFKHTHIYSSSGHVAPDVAIVRPPTQAQAFRLAATQLESHEVENLSAKPSEFLQLELKTHLADEESFRGRYYPEAGIQNKRAGYNKIEFENEEIRIRRLVSGRGKKATLQLDNPALMVAFSPLKMQHRNRVLTTTLAMGEVKWLTLEDIAEQLQVTNAPHHQAAMLIVEFKTALPKCATTACKPLSCSTLPQQSEPQERQHE